MTHPIPRFYRFWFTTVDPFLAAVGAYGALFIPLQILGNYSPNIVIPPSPETLALLDVKAGFCIALAYLQVVLLRAHSRDVGVWRIMETSNTFVSLGMLSALIRAMVGQERLNPTLWGRGEITSLGVTVGLLTVRVAFVAGVGLD